MRSIFPPRIGGERSEPEWRGLIKPSTGLRTGLEWPVLRPYWRRNIRHSTRGYASRSNPQGKVKYLDQEVGARDARRLVSRSCSRNWVLVAITLLKSKVPHLNPRPLLLQRPLAPSRRPPACKVVAYDGPWFVTSWTSDSHWPSSNEQLSSG